MGATGQQVAVEMEGETLQRKNWQDLADSLLLVITIL